MPDNLRTYLNFIFQSYNGYKVGQGGFFLRNWLNNRTISQEFRGHLFDVVDVLLQNEVLYVDNPGDCLPFLKLGQNGYDYMQGGDLMLGKLDLTEIINLNEGKEKIFDHVWDFIGKQDSAPFCLGANEFYNAIAPYVGLTDTSCGHFLQNLTADGKSTSRIAWYRELFLSIPDHAIEGFLRDLSKAIVRVYQPFYSESIDCIAPTPAVGSQPRAGRKVIFISYTWETQITPGHKEWVRRLAENLRAKGFDVRLDAFLPLGSDMTHFMTSSVREAHRILLICTPTFKQRSDSMTQACGFEASLISHQLLKDILNIKFLPIARIGEPDDVMPDYLGNRNALIWHDTDDYDKKFNELVADLEAN